MSAILQELVETGRQLVRDNLVTGAGGNISARDEQGMWISPSGFSFMDAQEYDYPCVNIASGDIIQGSRRPSSEVLMHLWIYRVRPDVQAIIHTHPKMTIALTSAGHTLKPMYADYYVYLGSKVPHLPYVTVTTPELARAVETEFKDEKVVGCVLRNHGAITVGQSIKEAVFRTAAVEEQAFIQWHAAAVGTPTFLSEEELHKLDQLGSEVYRRALLSQMKPS
jgi:L-fuculose-phosphate aldolase